MHDKRALSLSLLASQPERFFELLEYLLGDSAYSACFPFVVAPFKKPASDIPRNRAFNYALARARIAIEHCIGILKARFPILMCLRGHIQSDDDIIKMCRLLVVCFILHNMCIETNDAAFDWTIPMTDTEPEPEEDDVQGETQIDDDVQFAAEEMICPADLRVCVQQQVLDVLGYQD